MNKYNPLHEPIFFTPPSGKSSNRRLYKGGGTTTTSSTSTPIIPDELKPLASLYTQQAMQYAQTPYKGYEGQRFADLNQAQNLGLGMVQNRALGGSETMNNAESALNRAIAGGQTNPYLDAMVAKAQGSVVDRFNTMVKPQTEAAMVQSGSFGNSGLQQLMQNQQKAAAQQMSDIATQMYGGAYEGDRSRQLQAIGMAPTFGNAPYQDASQLLNAGNIMQQQAQQGLDFGYQQFKEAQDYPLKQMSATGGFLGQNMGSSTTGTQPKSGK